MWLSGKSDVQEVTLGILAGTTEIVLFKDGEEVRRAPFLGAFGSEEVLDWTP
jgi:hypothetical protein